jgi:hypothetical protein
MLHGGDDFSDLMCVTVRSEGIQGGVADPASARCTPNVVSAHTLCRVYAGAQTGCKSAFRMARRLQRIGEAMPDVYLYHFVSRAGPGAETNLSARPATLETIKGNGEPIMESQIVVDHTELDKKGFLIGANANESPASRYTRRRNRLSLKLGFQDRRKRRDYSI